ncbi:MAG: energy transducer TonB [Pseudomonadota bacterium]
MTVAGPNGSRGSNRLIRGLILASAVIHLFVLMYLSGIYRSEPPSYIELEIRDARRDVRPSPRPPRRASPPAPRVPSLPPEPAYPAPTPLPVVPPPPAVNGPSPAFPPPPAPGAAAPPPSRAASWSPPLKPSVPGGGAVSGGAAVSGGTPVSGEAVGSPNEYLDLVRSMIERRKQYPHSARKRRLQGRVVVRFVIWPDGTAHEVSFAEKSPLDILNQAALRAVRDSAPFPAPPREYFSGPVELEVSLVFKLG